MEDSNWDDLKITHVVNPYGIWVSNLSKLDNTESGNVILEMSFHIEEEYKKFSKNQSDDIVYVIGQVVGIYHQGLKLWVRGIVDDTYGEKSFLVWLLDFGFHLSKVTLPEYVMPLAPERLTTPPPITHKYGIYGILPVHLVPDALFTTFETKPSKFWVPAALKVMEEHIRRSTNVKFLKKRDHTFKNGSEQVFGHFKLVIEGKELDLADILVNNKLAVYDEKKFIESLPTIKNVLSIDRIVPHTSKQIQTGKEMMEYLERESQTTNNAHCQFVANWTRKATKIVKSNLMDPIEDIS